MHWKVVLPSLLGGGRGDIGVGSRKGAVLEGAGETEGVILNSDSSSGEEATVEDA